LGVAREEGFLADKVTEFRDPTDVKGDGLYKIPTPCCKKESVSCSKPWVITCLANVRTPLAEIEQMLVTYVDLDHKAEIDWSDPEKREQRTTQNIGSR
jgi:hypothetical protein